MRLHTGVYGHRGKVCTESGLWEKNPLRHGGSPWADLHVVGMLQCMSFDINQLSLPTLLYSVLVSVSVFMALSTVFHSIHPPDNSPFSDSSSGLTSALLVLSIVCLFMTVSFNPDIIPSG